MKPFFRRLLSFMLLAFVSIFNLPIPSGAADLLWIDGVACARGSSCKCCAKTCCGNHEPPAKTSSSVCFRAGGCGNGKRAVEEGVVCPALDEVAIVSEGRMTLFWERVSLLKAVEIRVSLLCSDAMDKPPRFS